MSNEALLAAEQPDKGLSSQEVMLHLTEVQRDRYVKLQETFESPGWKMIAEWFKAKATEALVAQADAKTWEANRTLVGARMTWQSAATIDTAFMNEFEAIAQQAMEDPDIVESMDDLEAE